MEIFIDSKYRCHTDNPNGNFRKVEHPFFEGKCKTLIGGYCYNDSNGYVQIYPWKPYNELDAAQREYEKQKLSNCLEALQELGVET